MFSLSRQWIKRCVGLLASFRIEASRKRRLQSQRLAVDQLEPRCVPTTISGTISTNTELTIANSPYVINGNLQILSGVTVTVDAGVSVQEQPGVTLTDNGSLTFANGDAVNLIGYFSTQQILVASGGFLNATGTTFSASGNTNTGLITVNSGGHLQAMDSTFASSFDQVDFDNGSILNAGDLTGNSFNCPLYLPENEVQYLSGAGNNNAQFQDIDILAGSVPSGQTLALNAIGTASTANLLYVFSGNFTVINGATLNVAANVQVQLQAGVTLTDYGMMTFANDDAVNLVGYFSTQQIVVGNNGLLGITGTTFSASGNTNTGLITVSSGGHLQAMDSTFASSFDQVDFDNGSILNAGDLTGNSFNCPLYLPENEVQYLSGAGNNNAQFQDIDILAGSVPSGQTLALNAIGTASTANLLYVFSGNFTVINGATLNVAANVQVQLQAGVTLTDYGMMTFANDDAVNLVGYFSTQQIVVGNNGLLGITGTTFSASGNTNTGLITVSSGGHLQAMDSTFVLNNMSLNSGSTDAIQSSNLSTQLNINSSASININSNNFSNATVVANGDPNAKIDLRYNGWGTTVVTQIAAKITDHVTDPTTRPFVLYLPFLNTDPASQFMIGVVGLSTVAAGSSFIMGVTALDASSNVATNYTGTVVFTSTDPQAPTPAVSMTLNNGTGFAVVTLKTAGTWTVTAADSMSSSINGQTSAIQVLPSTATHFSVTAPSVTESTPIVSGTSGVSQLGSTVTLVTTVASGLTAGQMVQIAGVGVSGYNEIYTLLSASGTSLTYTDTQTGLPNSGGGTVSLYATAGTAFTANVTALDAYGNVATGYAGTVHFASSDPLVSAASATITPTGAHESGSNVTITTTGAHGLAAGQLVIVSGMGVTGYDGTFRINAVPSSTTFTYTDTVTGLADSGNGTVSGGLPVPYTFTTGTGGDNGVHSFALTLGSPGSQTITVSDTSATNPVIAGTSGAVQVVGLQVTSVVGNPTGFTVNFNEPFNPATLKLYGTSGADPDMLFESTNNQIEQNPGEPQQLTGSVVPSANDTSFTFVETAMADENGGLPNGVYEISLLSSTNGIKDASGAPLDASNSPITSPNLYTTIPGQTATAYSNSFTLSTITPLTDTMQITPTQVAVSLPAFAQGPGLPVHVQLHNTGGAGGVFAGIPATISDGNEASTVSFSVTYNTALLTVTGGVVDQSILAGYPKATFSRTTAGTPVGGMETDTFTFSTGDGSFLSAGAFWTLGDITASVPNVLRQKIYKDKQVLTVSNITSDGAANGGVTNADLVGGNGFEAVAYLGDTSGDGNISLNDATLANNVGNPLFGGGFPAYPLIDPAVLADTDGAGFVDSSSVGNIASLAIGHAQATIPTPPAGRMTSSGGADPDLSLPSQLRAANGLVEVPVNLDNAMPAGSTGLTEATLDLSYNPRVLTVSAADVHLGSLPSLGTGWTVSSVVNQAAGQLVVQLYSSTPLTVSVAGSLVMVNFHMFFGAQGTGNVSLVDWANPTGQVWFRTSLSDTNGALTLGNSTAQAGVSGAGRGGESSLSAVMATNAINALADAKAERAAQANDIVESLADASGSDGDAIFVRTGPSGLPSDPATQDSRLIFGPAPAISVQPLITPFQLLAAEVFSDLGRSTIASEDQGLMDHGQTADGEPNVVNDQALEELFAQMGME